MLRLEDLARLRREGRPRGMASVCSAHPLVLRAALRHGLRTGAPVLIEATCNQVNHQGGYTGMTPADFAALVRRIAAEEGCPPGQLLLGGDHLGPNPWRALPAEAAMAEAARMVAAYVAAGFSKIHLDTSMGCAGEPAALEDATTARRAARLARIADETARSHGLAPPRFILGTEVPPPGGADHALDSVAPTAPDAARATIAIHHETFAQEGLEDAFDRVLAFVVQPGVEFGNRNVALYDRTRARPLTAVLAEEPGLVFEAHSTDYQGPGPLAALVEDGFPILKVGPELTFVLREALYALDLIATELVPGYGTRPLAATMERVMRDRPADWQRHYPGSAADQHLLRHYSLSDRIRYYWPDPEARQAVDALTAALARRRVPLPLWRQFLPAAEDHADRPLDPEALLIERVTASLATYHAACHPDERKG
ncbi:D-tagatose-bisphosphate aldolase, class II, non-catalytic subunit [Cereibacter azotoformans]|uniref:Tagatose-bisphosphate aldolase noncatalytic subunit n=1 Tax=Cereibacter sphaeroides (strain ATCC 17025 / ATH 2.4.3) TaxID=349102 RepID=A4WYJ2_CERS5|nr:D-tagatose-bisphosphate aldolase, class II, non-catalytic subunit [Cereibacter azotoformans]ULB11908.1 D-tagatose-bisphosphate aldolase, class II, non-catalytic subunit [Cereibacter azotoformans]